MHIQKHKWYLLINSQFIWNINTYKEAGGQNGNVPHTFS